MGKIKGKANWILPLMESLDLGLKREKTECCAFPTKFLPGLAIEWQGFAT
jgi:hypothetical protein